MCQIEYDEEHKDHEMILLGDNRKGKRKIPNFIEDKNKLREIQLSMENLQINKSYTDSIRCPSVQAGLQGVPDDLRYTASYHIRD